MGDVENIPPDKEDVILLALGFVGVLSGGGTEDQEGFLPLPHDPASLPPLLEASNKGDLGALNDQEVSIPQGKGIPLNGADSSHSAGDF
ncbi:MAG: hypothetical protein EBZ49_13730 [Proteobacteria bacterium]|nr:hypothetical protein [Pseudomonadota bacterium]